MSSLRTLLRQVLHLKESPRRTALAFAIGVFIAFSPTYGLHTAMVVFCTWAFGLNFIALMAGALINNPWTLVPILGATYWTGALVIGGADPPGFDWHDVSFAGIYRQVLPYAAPFFLGGMLLSILGALLSYPAAYYVLARYRRRPHDAHESLPPSNDVG